MTLLERVLLTGLIAFSIFIFTPFTIGAVRVVAHSIRLAVTTRIDCVTVPFNYDAPKDCPK